MAEATLMLHRGARRVEYDELVAVKAPPPEGRWFPLAHKTVLEAARSTLAEAGYEVTRQQLGLSKDNQQFFGTLDLNARLLNGVNLAVGIRNSINRTLPIGFAAGNRVFCCDNMALRSELMVTRKHTRYGEQRFHTDIAAAVMKLGQFKDDEANRIMRLMRMELSPEVADSLILKAFAKGIINSHQIMPVVREWQEPSYGEFEQRTGWSLLNAFTTVLGPKAVTNPNGYALTTMRLNGLLDAREPQFIQAS